MEVGNGHVWRNQREGYLEALRYLQGRMKGEIKSIRSPWTKFNDATIDGLEWNTINVLAGRPGSLKTLIKDQFIRKAFELNPLEEFRVLEFQLEMLARTSAVRDFVSIVGKTYKHVCSAEGTLSQEELNRCHEYAKMRVKFPIDVVEEAPTVEEFERIIDAYMVLHKFKKTIITLDHSILIKKGHGEKDKQDTLHKLGECLTKLKKKYPIIFIILSQLNRNVDSPDRNEEGRYGNYPNDADVFGSDALLMHTDFLVAFDRPGKRKIKIYGPDKYIIADKTILIMHFLKARNTETQLSFFQADFDKMEIVEIPPPPTQLKRVSTI